MYVSAFHVCVLVVNDVLGIGLLNMPYATKYCGVSNLIIILAILTLITILTMTTIAYCSDISHSMTYEGAVRTVCGTTAYRITAFTLAVQSFFSCVIFLVIIGDQWKEIFLFMAKDHFCIVNPWYMHKTFIVSVTSAVFILPLCYLESLKCLAYPSGLGVFGITYICVLVVIKYFLSEDIDVKLTRSHDVGSVSLAVTSLVFSCEGHIPIVLIYSCMTVRKLKTFCYSVTIAVFICTIFYGLTGIFGYLTFGDSVASNIFLSYEPKAEICVGVLMLCLKTYTTYPVMSISGREALVSLFDKFSEEKKLKDGKKNRIIISTIWYILSLIAALYIPFIGIIVRYQGVLAFLLVLIFPGLCLLFLKEDYSHPPSWKICRLILASMLIVVGVFLMTMTLVQSMQTDLMHPDDIRPDTSKYTC